MSQNIFKNKLTLNLQSGILDQKYSEYEYELFSKYSLWFSIYGLIVSCADALYESFVFKKVENDPKFKFIYTTRLTSYLISGIFLIQCLLFKYIKKNYQRIIIYLNYILVVIPLYHFRTLLYEQGLIEENLYAMIRTFEILERMILIILNLASMPNAFIMNFLSTLILWIYTPFVTGLLGMAPYVSAAIVLTVFSYFYKMQVKLNFCMDYSMKEQNIWYLNLLDHMNSGFISSSTNNILFMNRYIINLIDSLIQQNKNILLDDDTQKNITNDDMSSIFEKLKNNYYSNKNFEDFSSMYRTKLQTKNEELLADKVLTLLLKNLKTEHYKINSNQDNFNLKDFMEKMKILYNDSNFDQTFIFLGNIDIIIEKESDILDHKMIRDEFNYEVFMRCKITEPTNKNLLEVLNPNLIGKDEEFEFIFIDTTKTKKQERKNADLLYKTKFLSKIEHEFKNPLISITELTEQLSNEVSIFSDKNQENRNLNLIKQIKSLSNYLLILIKDLNYFSLTNFGIQPKLETRETDLDEILNFCRDMAEILLIKYNKSQVKFKIQKNFPETLIFMIDGTKLIQIIVNLISNSIKYTHMGTIDLIVNYSITDSNKEFLEFQVKDTGIGISPDQIQQIYKKPFILENVDNENFDFTIGINFVNEILDRLNSKLIIESNREGSIFSFSIKLTKKLNDDDEGYILNLKNKKFSPYRDLTNVNVSQNNSFSTRKVSSWDIKLDEDIRMRDFSIEEINDNIIPKNKTKNNLEFFSVLGSKKLTGVETYDRFSEINDVSFDLNTKFLIVVDDEKLTRMSTTRMLNRTMESIAHNNSQFNPENFKILECEDGLQCLYLTYNLLKKGYTDITIISDENMPHMKGSTCAEILKKLNNLNVNHIKFILLSAYSEIKNSSLDYFISKPLSDAEATKILLEFVEL